MTTWSSCPARVRRSQAQLMREVLGYVPIEPDGSVSVKVPANVAFWPEILDGDGRRIEPRHQNWLQLRPGEDTFLQRLP
jgi:hypothetical protein